MSLQEVEQVRAILEVVTGTVLKCAVKELLFLVLSWRVLCDERDK